MKPTGPFLEVVSRADEPDAEMDGDVQQLLAAARAWAEPTGDNRERVSAALRSALPVLSSTSGVTRATALGAAQGARALNESLRPRAAPISRTPLLIIGGALIGALAFWLGHGLGYGSGYGAAQREASSAAGAAAVATLDVGDGAGSSAPVERALSADPAVATGAPMQGAEATGARAPASAEAGAAPRSRRAMSGSTRPASRGNVAGADSSALTAPAPPARLSFREVLDQLRRAQQQLRNGQATMSLLVLSELDRAAGDVLLEERNVTRVLALCAAGQDEAARDVARRLEHDSPRSIYGMRLEASCVSEPAVADDDAP